MPGAEVGGTPVDDSRQDRSEGDDLVDPVPPVPQHPPGLATARQRRLSGAMRGPHPPAVFHGEHGPTTGASGTPAEMPALAGTPARVADGPV